MHSFPGKSSLLAVALFAAMPAVAQTAPDAGRTMQLLTPPLAAPVEPAPLDLQAPPLEARSAGGAVVSVARVVFAGNSVYDDNDLSAVVGNVAGQSLDLAGLEEMANRVSQYYRANGYPFARAYLPAQSIEDGIVRIEVIEGRYGRVLAVGNEALVDKAEGFLASLESGTVITSEQLERATLILDSLPGIRISPIIRPGQVLGTGDLEVGVVRDRGLTGDVSLDNHGNRYTGTHNLRVNLQANSPLFFGDQLTLRALYSEENTWLGGINYSVPLGASGLRGVIGYSHTTYVLSKEFASLQATGSAKVGSLGVTYPVLRSHLENLTLAASYEYKRFNDRKASLGTDDNKRSETLPISLNFDRRDAFAGGGVTYGALTYQMGKLSLRGGLETNDRATGMDTRGRFDKWNLDVARIQAMPVNRLTLFGRLSAQWSDKNLDSSEGFGLGGANGVRAYPNGEGVGDTGWLMQFEVRYLMGNFTPYAFYDSGRVELNANPPTAADEQSRSLTGVGVGVRYQWDGLTFDGNVAWRIHGREAQSDSKDLDPRFWVTLGYRF